MSNPFKILMNTLVIGIIAILLFFIIRNEIGNTVNPNEVVEHHHSVTQSTDTTIIPSVPDYYFGTVKPEIRYIIRKIPYPVHDSIMVQVHDSILVKDSVPEITIHDTLNGDTIYFHAYPKYISIFDYWNVEYSVRKKPNYIIHDSVAIKDSTIITKKENPYIKWLYFGGGILLYYGVKQVGK